MADLDQFNTRIGRIAAKLEKGFERTIRTAALVVDQTVVMATPVDTGRARANWIVQIGGPAREIKEPAGNAGASANAALQQGRDEVAKFKLSDGSIWVCNNLPYIQRLNDGWSKQAPKGFVQKGIRTAVAAVQKARLLEE